MVSKSIPLFSTLLLTPGMTWARSESVPPLVPKKRRRPIAGIGRVLRPAGVLRPTCACLPAAGGNLAEQLRRAQWQDSGVLRQKLNGLEVSAVSSLGP